MNSDFLQQLEFVVKEEHQNLRLDTYLSIMNDNYSRSFFQKLIKQNKVLVNESPVKVSYKLDEGDEIVVNIPSPKKWHILPEKIPLNIIHEDEYILVVNKTAGMVVHPGAGVFDGTLVNALLAHCGNLSTLGGIIRPGIVHRLDKNTSGLLVVAKNDKSHIFLQNQFKERTISRKYLSLVWGNFKEPEGKIEGNISRSKSDRKTMAVIDNGKSATTFYKVIEEFNFCTLLELRLATGRTHQIRVHMKHTHHPVIGDPEYNGRESQLSGLSAENRKLAKHILNNLEFQFLHAYHLHFIHPQTKQLVEFSSPLPQNLKQVITFLKESALS